MTKILEELYSFKAVCNIDHRKSSKTRTVKNLEENQTIKGIFLIELKEKRGIIFFKHYNFICLSEGTVS